MNISFERILLDETAHFHHFAAAIGFFDGVHRGHQYLLHNLHQVARERGWGTMVISFAQHPRHVLGHASAPALLTPREHLPELLRPFHVHECTLLHFTSEMAAMSARQFMEEVLRDRLGIRTLLIGYDHHFGRPQAGEGFEQYRSYGEELGIEVVCADALVLPNLPDEIGQKLSSSTIRQLLTQGQVHTAAQLLNRPYRVVGRVAEGRKNGRKLGYPTANLRPQSSQQLIPQLGVYATRTWIDGVSYGSMTNIGCRPTLDNGQDISIETHIFDFDAQVYGQTMGLDFVERLRDEQRFESMEALIAQLGRDAVAARTILAQSFLY